MAVSTKTSERPWLAHYDRGVPTTLAPYERLTLVELVERQARAHPDRVALRFEGADTTYAALLAQARAFARALEDRGVKRGDRVALLLPNVPQFVVAELGAWMAGAIVAPTNPTYPDEELAGLLARAGATVAVVLAPFYDKLKAVQARTAVRHVVVAHVRDALAFPKSLLFRLFRERRDGHGTEPRGEDARMSRVLADYRGAMPSSAPPRPEESATLLPSGGTTGTPKWVEGTHGGLAVSGQQLAAWLAPVLAGEDVFLAPLPLFHTYALSGIQSLAFSAGLSLALVPNPRDTAGMLATIRRERPRFICGVPTLLTAIMSHRDAPKTRDAFREVKLCFSGAAPLLAETRRRFEELTGGVIMEGYSLTEAQMAVIGNPAVGEKKLGSVGMPLPDVELRIVDVDDPTRELAAGESGEVLISAPQIMRGYWNQPEETAAAVTTVDGRRWLHTGDIGHVDADGYLFLTDRKKELMKVSGFQVWPREVEEAVAAHPAVLEAGVAPVIDPVKGEVAKAWVVLRAGQSVTADELRAFCRGRLAPYKVPAQVSIVRELPKTAVGKVLRRKLRELDAPRA
ncbi:MAG: AMP-binding protein [Gemmatimonadaceae bacterium]|nr:AMP-binding protein [Gemmatimonadaceae bacterium]NUQ94742.1 AMP-binding protein [Gemmatimonadaceae bacterium]NUR18091.1 AMP-binding protein [Gemmatimonadaceae bacterium]NUS95959.1 AMP-binding protein [Gemmatimonadaceae bacterium]